MLLVVVMLSEEVDVVAEEPKEEPKEEPLEAPKVEPYTANIFEVIFTVFNCVPISTVILLYGLHFIAAPSTV